MAKYLGFFMVVLLPLTAFAQKKADRKILDNLQQHITRLSQDSSANDATGYMEKQFQETGLSKINGSYRQPIISDAGKVYTPGTTLSLNDTALKAGNDFVPLPFSGQGSVQGFPLIAVQEQNQPWIMDLNNYLDNQPAYADSQVAQVMYRLASQAMNDQAVAVLFYSSAGNIPLPGAWPKTDSGALQLPVVFIQPAVARDFFDDPTASIHIDLTVAFSEKKDTAYNVIGNINNNAPYTVIIGAHDRGDKASLIELGRLLQQDKRFRKENYLLVAFCKENSKFSGEQEFFKNPPVDTARIRCFINLRHTGQADAGHPALYRYGNITPEWQALLDKAKIRDLDIQSDPMNGDTTKTSWPVLSFSAPEDSTLNAAGELTIVKYLDGLIKEINRMEK